MRWLLTILSVVIFSSIGYGQIFSPLKEKIKQVAKLKIYIDQLEKGYEIARKGLKVIGDLKNGHFSLDLIFFAGLETVNPGILNFVSELKREDVYEEVVQELVGCLEVVRGNPEFSGEDRTYVASVVNNALKDCELIYEQTNGLLSKGAYKMSDNERLSSIEKGHKELTELLSFARYFKVELQVQILLRRRQGGAVRGLSEMIDAK